MSDEKRPWDSEPERVENEVTDVEKEHVGDDVGLHEPWDPSLIRVDPKQYSLRQIDDMINDKELDLDPDFQRHRVWGPRQKSHLVESVLLRIPLPAFYFSADEEGRMQVVDGLQRLSREGEIKKHELPLLTLATAFGDPQVVRLDVTMHDTTALQVVDDLQQVIPPLLQPFRLQPATLPELLS